MLELRGGDLDEIWTDLGMENVESPRESQIREYPTIRYLSIIRSSMGEEVNQNGFFAKLPQLLPRLHTLTISPLNVLDFLRIGKLLWALTDLTTLNIQIDVSKGTESIEVGALDEVFTGLSHGKSQEFLRMMLSHLEHGGEEESEGNQYKFHDLLMKERASNPSILNLNSKFFLYITF